LRFVLRPLHKKQLVVSGAFGAINATSGDWYELSIAFVERCLFQEQEDVVLYPMMEMRYAMKRIATKTKDESGIRRMKDRKLTIGLAFTAYSMSREM